MTSQSDEERRAHRHEYDKQWYQRHKDRLRQKRKQHDADLKRWLEGYKSQLQCIYCGESHPACLQFHHRDQQGKSFNVGGVIGQWRYITLKKLQAEISKCDVVCGNCHAKLHWQERAERNAAQR
jgi:hypothetical protein